MNSLKIEKKHILNIIISSLIIVIFHNLKIDNYLKNVIVPFTTLTISYIIIFFDKDVDKKKYLLMIPIFLILISNFFIKIDDINQDLNIIVLPILISIFFLIYTNKNYKLCVNSFNFVFKLFPKGLFSNLKFLKFDFDDEKYNKIKNILIGIVFGGIIGIIILFLLSLADDYFMNFIDKIIPSLNINFGNIILFVFTFIILFSIFVNICLNKNQTLPSIKIQKVEDTIITTVLVIINTIFMLFLISEISRLTINFLNIPKKYTYSSYAREGFFELLFVTIINFIVIMYILYKTNKVNESKVIKILLLILAIFSILLIFNSYYRMFLYIGHYGLLTTLRFQVILFLTMELIIFILIINKVLKKIKMNDALIYYIIVTVFYILNIYLCNTSVVDMLNRLFK